MKRPVSRGCPKCEFSNGTPGRPEIAGKGLMRCHVCANIWRDMGQPVNAGQGAGLAWLPAAALLDMALHRRGKFLFSADTALWLALALTLLAFAAQPAWQSRSSASRQAGFLADNNLSVSVLSTRQLLRDGQIAVQVEGRIINNSATRQLVGEIIIVLRHAQGHRIYSWKHHPAVAFLDPGQALRFSSSNGNVPHQANKVEIRSGAALASASL